MNFDLIKIPLKNIKIVIIGMLLLFSNQLVFSQNNTILDSLLIVKDKEMSISELLKLIERKSDLKFTYSPSRINDTTLISACNTPCTIGEYLNQIAKKANLDLVINNSNILLLNNNSWGITDKLSVSGYVKDFETGEVLLGASILSLKSKTGMTTDENGFFYFDNISENDTIQISYVGYSPLLLYDGALKKSIKSDFFLRKSNVLKDVIINSESSVNGFSYRKFDFYKTLIALHENTSSLGNNDVLKELTKMPGIEKINDLQGGISINGLPPQDNVYLLDGVRIFEPNHVFGLFSSFSKSSINKVSVYSNFSPLNYSNSYSGVVNSHLVEGNFQRHSAEFDFSNSSVGMFVSGPILKYKTSYFVDMRKSILNFYIPQLVKQGLDFENIDFYDMNFKITHRISMGNKINIFFYKGHDNIRINNSIEELKTSNRYLWGNFAYGLKWEYLALNSIKSNITFALSNYKNNSTSIFEFNKNSFDKSYLSIFSLTNIKEVSFKHDLKFYSGKSVFKAGYKFSKYSLLPTLKGQISENVIDYNSLIQSDKDSIYTNITGYASNEYTYRFQGGVSVQ